MADIKKLFGRFELTPSEGVTEEQVRSDVRATLMSLGKIESLYVGDDQLPPQSPPPPKP